MLKTDTLKKAAEKLTKGRYVLLVLALGLVLILLPVRDKGKTAAESEETCSDISAPAFALESEEERLEKTLSSISGAGGVKVLLSLESTSSRQLAESNGEAIVVSAGSGVQDAVVERFTYPVYKGAVVVCEGADSVKVKLDITLAVQAFTGLGSDKISVFKMK